MTVAFEREQARDAFARFVPEAVVDEVLRSADGVAPRWRAARGHGHVLRPARLHPFAETLEPATVIEALNRYLTAMSEAILDHGGTLVAYMGDGIMAVFGAPLTRTTTPTARWPRRARCSSRMEGFNAWLREEGLHDGFKMGIGLNSGPVMSGNVGSERRLEYTALGDTTNTAARLEGMTKGTPYQLYVADSTRTRLSAARRRPRRGRRGRGPRAHGEGQAVVAAPSGGALPPSPSAAAVETSPSRAVARRSRTGLGSASASSPDCWPERAREIR